MVDGLPVNSCLIPVVQADGTTIVSVEGIANDERLDPIQEAFIKYGAAQCGICTPGFVVCSTGAARPRPPSKQTCGA